VSGAVDRTTKLIVDYAREVAAGELSDAVRTAALHHLVDTVAVAIAGAETEQAGIAARVAATACPADGATVIGHGVTSTPELAAFANAVMVRTYDWNDGMQAKGGGHPSDMTSGVLAIGEVCRASGADVLRAVTLAYELLGGLGAEITIGDLGYDQGLFMAPATALACGVLLGLDEEQLANAASLALVPNVPLGVSRWGALSMMKGCATAFGVRSGVFAALLAREGMTGSAEPFEGIYGLHHLTGAFEPRLPVLPGGPAVVEMAHQKPVPAETQVLALLELVPQIRAFAPVEDIEVISVGLPDHAYEHIADPPKYDPKTRETADHSLPYMLAVALVAGTITLDSYRPERFLDPALRPVMARIECHADDDLTAMRSDLQYGVTRPAPARIVVRRKDGQEYRNEVLYYRGHWRNPLSRDDIERKFASITARCLSDEEGDRIRAAWWEVSDAPDIAPLMGLLRVLPPTEAGKR
jgi:2-methylcitrate dehydratase